MNNYIIKTERLGLRNWTDQDIEPATIMNADPKVREFFPNTLTKEETIAFIRKTQTHFNEHGFCFFAVDKLDTNEFIGFTGLNMQTFESDFTPSVEIGWRLLQKHWGNGYATEAAKACLHFAFAELKLPEVYAVAPKLNKNSQKVMQKIGMNYFKEFAHPWLADDSELKTCVAYKISND